MFIYLYLQFDNGTIRAAVNLWTCDREEAMRRHGHISAWLTGEVTDMSSLFDDKEDFNEDISKWDVRRVTNMGYMFYSASSFNQPLEKWEGY